MPGQQSESSIVCGSLSYQEPTRSCSLRQLWKVYISMVLTKTLERRLDGCYTRLLRHALNISWQQKVRNVVLYKDLPAISTVIKERRLRFAGHCHRATTEPIHSVIFWQPAHGKKSVGGQRKTFVDRLASDTGLGVGDMKTAMNDRKGWKEFVQAENRQRSTR